VKPVRKRIAFDHLTWNALDSLSKDWMVDLQEERFLSAKHKRSVI